MPLADDLHVSVEDINLTVTSYLVISGLAPSITGSCADTYGRRPALVVALLIYVASNVVLAVQTSFVALFLLRMVQSAGISGGSLACLKSRVCIGPLAESVCCQ